jgi:tetratricopeptide (TPR) repeat protein
LDSAPGFIEARAKLGYVLLLQKKYADAEAQFREQISRYPDNLYAHLSLGLALAGQLRDGEALPEYQAARQLQPDNNAIAQMLAATTQRIKVEEMLTNLTAQLATRPTPEIHMQIAQALTFLGNYQEAIDHYQQALALKADAIDGLNNLAWLLATCPDKALRDGPRAVTLAEQACKLTQNQTTVFLGTLAAAQAEAGRFEEAIATAQKACANASARGETNLLKTNQDLLGFYQKHQAWHEPERLQPIPPPSSFEGAPQ